MHERALRASALDVDVLTLRLIAHSSTCPRRRTMPRYRRRAVSIAEHCRETRVTSRGTGVTWPIGFLCHGFSVSGHLERSCSAAMRSGCWPVSSSIHLRRASANGSCNRGKLFQYNSAQRVSGDYICRSGVRRFMVTALAASSLALPPNSPASVRRASVGFVIGRGLVFWGRAVPADDIERIEIAWAEPARFCGTAALAAWSKACVTRSRPCRFPGC